MEDPLIGTIIGTIVVAICILGSIKYVIDRYREDREREESKRIRDLLDDYLD